MRLADVRGHVIDLSLLPSEPLVLDLGANRGEFSSSLRKRVGGGRYVLFEPNPALADGLRESGLLVEQCAVADTAGEMPFNIAKNDEASSLTTLPATSWVGAVLVDQTTVRVRALSDVLKEQDRPVDLLKVDIEGAETKALRSLSPEQLAGVGQITVEFHSAPLFGGITTREEAEATIRHVAAAGFLVLDFTARRPRHPLTDVLFVNRRRLRSRRDVVLLKAAGKGRPPLEAAWRIVRRRRPS